MSMTPEERYLHDPEFHHLVKIIRDELRSLKGTDPTLVDDWALCVASAVKPLDPYAEAILKHRMYWDELLLGLSAGTLEWSDPVPTVVVR